MAKVGFVFLVVSGIAVQVLAAEPPERNASPQATATETPADQPPRLDRTGQPTSPQHGVGPYRHSIPNAVRPPAYAPSVPGSPYTQPPLTPVPPRKPGDVAPTPNYPQPQPPVYYPTPQKRQIVRLKNVPAADVAETLNEFLNREKAERGPYSPPLAAARVVFVPEPISNSLLISGSPSQLEEITELISKLDVQPDMVAVDVLIAEMDSDDEQPVDGETAEGGPSMEEDGAAWVEWAMESKRIQTLSRPRIMTLNNQAAFVQVGQRLHLPTKTGRNEAATQFDVGLTLGLTPRVSPEGVVVMELDVEHSSIAQCRGEPVLRKASAQTTLSVKDNQTIVLGGLLQRSDDGNCQLVIAVTPRINPNEDSETAKDEE